MRRVHLAELRASWTTWAGVALAFVTTNLALMLSALTLLAGVGAVRSGTMDWLDSAAFVYTPAQNLVFCAIVGAVVIGTATQLALGARRGALARLALGGATPGQIVGTVMLQLTAVSVVSSLIGAALALALLDPTLKFLTYERAEAGTPMPQPEPVYALWPLLLAGVLAVAVALIGGAKEAVRASRVAPVEALRVAAGDGAQLRMTWPRVVGAALTALILVIGFVVIGPLTATPNKETVSNLVTLSMGVLILMALLLSLLAPALVGPLTRAWVRLVPVPTASWRIARRTVGARAKRLIRSVVPVMMTIGLLLGMLAIWGSLESTLAANGYDIQLSATGPASLLVFLGLPLAIALAGGVGALIMMSKQRDAELALLGVVGATPRQRLVIPLLEAVIITGTAAILGLVMAVVAVLVLVVGLPLAGMSYALVPPVPMAGATLAVTLTITVAATVLPTLRGLREVEPVLIGRLVAD